MVATGALSIDKVINDSGLPRLGFSLTTFALSVKPDSRGYSIELELVRPQFSKSRMNNRCSAGCTNGARVGSATGAVVFVIAAWIVALAVPRPPRAAIADTADAKLSSATARSP